MSPTVTIAAFGLAQSPSDAPPHGDTTHQGLFTFALSPPLIYLWAVATMFVVLLCSCNHSSRSSERRRRRRRLLQSPLSALDFESTSTFSFGGGSSSSLTSSPSSTQHGLNEAVIRALPASKSPPANDGERPAAANLECAVCLLEFEGGDGLRTLPLCAHAFHVDCIDVWLRSNATCPLCRAAVVRGEAPVVLAPVRSERIRPVHEAVVVFVDRVPSGPVEPRWNCDPT